MHRTIGGVIAGTLFVLPGVIVIGALSWLYAPYQHVPAVTALFFGLKAAVLAVVIEAVLRVGKRALKNRVGSLSPYATGVWRERAFGKCVDNLRRDAHRVRSALLDQVIPTLASRVSQVAWIAGKKLGEKAHVVGVVGNDDEIERPCELDLHAVRGGHFLERANR